MTAIASQITSLTIVYLIVYSGTDKRKHQSSASLAFVRGIPRTKGQLRGKYFHLMTSSFQFHIMHPPYSAHEAMRPPSYFVQVITRGEPSCIILSCYLVSYNLPNGISNQYFIIGLLACFPGVMAINLFFVVFCCGDINMCVYTLYFLANLKPERSLKMIKYVNYTKHNISIVLPGSTFVFPHYSTCGWFSRDVLPVTCCEHGPPSIATVHFSNCS